MFKASAKAIFDKIVETGRQSRMGQTGDFALLGDIAFDLLHAPKTLNEKHQAVYAEHQVLSGKPVLQAMGLDLIEMTLTIGLNHQLGDVQARYQALIGAKKGLKPLALVLGKDFVGHFVITEISSQTLVSDNQGVALARDVNITLKEFAGEINQTALGEAVQRGANSPLSAILPTGSALKFGSSSRQMVGAMVSAYRRGRQMIGILRDNVQMMKQNPLNAITHLPEMIERLGITSGEIHKITAKVPELARFGSRFEELSLFADGLSRMAGQFDLVVRASGNVTATNANAWINVSSQALETVYEISENALPLSTTLTAWIALRTDLESSLGDSHER